MSSPIILNQWQHGECAGFSILGALTYTHPHLDHARIAKELIDEDWNSFTLKIAEKWFIKKGYMKWLRRCTYSPFLLRKQPIITGFTNVNWAVTGSAPYMLTYEKRVTVWSHYGIIVSPWKVQNSYWPDWGDHGFFYFQSNQIRNMKQMFAIIL